jgi:hypothetical protein
LAERGRHFCFWGGHSAWYAKHNGINPLLRGVGAEDTRVIDSGAATALTASVDVAAQIGIGLGKAGLQPEQVTADCDAAQMPLPNLLASRGPRTEGVLAHVQEFFIPSA